MAKDYFKDLKEASYPLINFPKAYSFDLNEDMIQALRNEFNPGKIIAQLAEALAGKTGDEAEQTGKGIFAAYGRNWIKRTMQLGEEYPDRTIEVVKETVDRQGKQFLLWPHVPQRFVEIAYLSTQKFLTLPVTLNNQYEFAYRVPQCLLFNQIKEKCGQEVANLMTCKHACLEALETLHHELDLTVVIDMPASNAKEGYCQFSVKKL